MIGRLTGVIAAQQPPLIVLDVNGVGYEILAPMSTFYQLPMETTQAVTVLTHLITREDAMTLYGFLTENERALFRVLIRVNGVGPKMALAILSGMTVEEFVTTIDQENVKRLTKLPGVGAKTAGRILVELKDRLGDFDRSENTESGVGANLARRDALSALIALGYREQDANKVLAKLPEDCDNSQTLIKEALNQLARSA